MPGYCSTIEGKQCVGLSSVLLILSSMSVYLQHQTRINFLFFKGFVHVTQRHWLKLI